MSLINCVIFNRWTGAAQVTAEIECAENTSLRVKIGLAVGRALEIGANLSGADLSDADLNNTDLSHADLSDADLSDADLSDANLSHADLSHASLNHADLSVANLCGADLRGASLCGADLRGASLNHADLRGVDLCGADLRGASLNHADLRGVDLIDAGQSTRGYRHIGWLNKGVTAIRGGCHDFTIAEAQAYWGVSYEGSADPAEINLKIDLIEAEAKRRGWRVE